MSEGTIEHPAIKLIDYVLSYLLTYRSEVQGFSLHVAPAITELEKAKALIGVLEFKPGHTYLVKVARGKVEDAARQMDGCIPAGATVMIWEGELYT